MKSGGVRASYGFTGGGDTVELDAALFPFGRAAEETDLHVTGLRDALKVIVECHEDRPVAQSEGGDQQVEGGGVDAVRSPGWRPPVGARLSTRHCLLAGDDRPPVPWVAVDLVEQSPHRRRRLATPHLPGLGLVERHADKLRENHLAGA